MSCGEPLETFRQKMTSELCVERMILAAGVGWGLLGGLEAGKPPCKSRQTQVVVLAGTSEELMEVFICCCIFSVKWEAGCYNWV